MTLCVIVVGSGAYWLNRSHAPKAAPRPVVTTAPNPLSLTQHDTFDVEFSKKLLLYHQLAAQLDDYAKVNATATDVREYAALKSGYNTAQASAYATMLDRWGEPYTDLEDFPKVAGSVCSGYPVFPGMLPHAKVSTYLQASAQEVDKQYLSLMVEHHNGINLLVKAEGHFVNYGELINLRDKFYTDQDSDMMQLKSLQNALGYTS